jgi:hypothetical protein
MEMEGTILDPGKVRRSAKLRPKKGISAISTFWPISRSIMAFLNGPSCRIDVNFLVKSLCAQKFITYPVQLPSNMSTQTQTESIVLHTRASAETPENEAQDRTPPEIKWMYTKILSAGVSFFVAGVNDGSLGSIIPYVIRTYGIGTNMVAVL